MLPGDPDYTLSDAVADGWGEDWREADDQDCTGGDTRAATGPSVASEAAPPARPPVQHIPLRASDGSARAYALVDAADFEWLNQWRWRLGTNGYVMRNDGPRTVYMQRAILGLEPGDPRQGEHEDRNPLNNQRSNLRIAERAMADNAQNLGPRSRSGFRGVYEDARDGRWHAQVGLAGRRHNLGRFDTPEEADAACKAFRAEHMPFSSDAKAAAR